MAKESQTSASFTVETLTGVRRHHGCPVSQIATGLQLATKIIGLVA